MRHDDEVDVLDEELDDDELEDENDDELEDEEEDEEDLEDEEEALVDEGDGVAGLRSFAVGLVLGAALGAGVAMLLTPERGETVRRRLGRNIRQLRHDAREQLDDWRGDAHKEIQRRRKRLQRRLRRSRRR